MHWIYFAFLSVICLSLASVLQKELMKIEDSDALSYSVVFQFTGALIILIFALINGFKLPPITQYPINFLLLGVLYGTGTFLSFKALNYLEASELTIIGSSRAIITIISAVLILGEEFNVYKAVGAALIIFSVIFVSRKSNNFTFNKGVLYALGYALCFGLAVTNDAFLIVKSDVLSYASISFLLPGLFLLFMKPTVIVKAKHFLKPNIFKKMLLFSVLYAFAAIFFFAAVAKGANASQMSPINQTSVIITVMIAALFLNERKNLKRKIFCSLLVVLGVWLLT